MSSLFLIKDNLKKMLEVVFSFFALKIYLVLIFFVNLFAWLVAWYLDREIDSEQVALHYNVDFGIDYYGDIKNIYMLPLIGAFVALMNFIFFVLIRRHRDVKFILHILFATTLLVNFIMLASVVSVYLVNFR